MALWFYRKGRTEYGPVNTKIIRGLVRSGRLLTNDAVRRPDSSTWRPAGRALKNVFDELFSEFEVGDTTDIPKEPKSQSKTSQSGSQKQPSNSDGLVGCSLFFVAIVVFGWLSWNAWNYYFSNDVTKIANHSTTPYVAQDSVSEPKGDKADSFRSQLRTWIQERQQLSNASTKLTEGRLELAQTMRRIGKDSPNTRVYAEEILELDALIKMLETKFNTYEAAIAKAESTLRRIERRKMLKDIGVSDNELNELAETVYELDDSLKKMTGKNVSLDLDVDDIMKEVFSDSTKERGPLSKSKSKQIPLKSERTKSTENQRAKNNAMRKQLPREQTTERKQVKKKTVGKKQEQETISERERRRKMTVKRFTDAFPQKRDLFNRNQHK